MNSSKTKVASVDAVQRWSPGQNPLTRERPFESCRLRPGEAALYAACLGPAICLAPTGALNWIIVLLLLPLNLLAFTGPEFPGRPSQSGGLRRILLLLIVIPVELVALEWVLVQAEIQDGLAITELSLVIVMHAASLLYLKSISHLPAQLRRTWSVRASCFMPLGLFCLWVLGAAEQLLPEPWNPIAGLPRLLAMLLLLAAYQLLRRRRGGRA